MRLDHATLFRDWAAIWISWILGAGCCAPQFGIRSAPHCQLADFSRLSSLDLGYSQVMAQARLRESNAAEIEDALSAYGTVRELSPVSTGAFASFLS